MKSGTLSTATRSCVGSAIARLIRSDSALDPQAYLRIPLTWYFKPASRQSHRGLLTPANLHKGYHVGQRGRLALSTVRFSGTLLPSPT
jgi:hypothetical protein